MMLFNDIITANHAYDLVTAGDEFSTNPTSPMEEDTFLFHEKLIQWRKQLLDMMDARYRVEPVSFLFDGACYWFNVRGHFLADYNGQPSTFRVAPALEMVLLEHLTRPTESELLTWGHQIIAKLQRPSKTPDDENKGEQP